MNSVQYAAKGSAGALAALIGWFNYGSDFTLSNGQSQTVQNSILGGYTVQFDVSYSLDPVVEEDVLEAFTAPVFDAAVPFG